MGLFGGTDATDLTPFLNMTKEAVNNAEGKMGQYDQVLEGFTGMGLESYNASQDLFGPWQERMNSIYENTSASGYATEQNQTYANEMDRFNQKAQEKFFAAGIPMGSGVSQQRGLSQSIQAAQYEAGTDYASKHQVNQIHEDAMKFGDAATQQSFNQMTAGVNTQGAVSDMYAANAANEMSYAMSEASIAGSQGMWETGQNMQREQSFMSSAGSLGGSLSSQYSGSSGFFSQAGDTNMNGSFDVGEPGYTQRTTSQPSGALANFNPNYSSTNYNFTSDRYRY